MSTIRLGQFELLAPIGRGGMGEIWQAVHTQQQIPVAIKLLTAEKALDPAFHHDFRREVGAAARLNHPSVVIVFDYGTVSEAAATDSRGLLIADGPYLVMELVNGGSLGQARGPLPWSWVRHVMLGLLDALAHAHARGLVHRDLKPENVLIERQEDVLPLIKLTDFGVAHILDRHSRTRGGGDTSRSREAVAGTPQYMAPEQVHGRWRDYGPWTDLYALGCLAYKLTCGSPPFRGDTFAELALAHTGRPPPPLKSTYPVPVGLEAWIHKLLEKDPRRRYRRAADAAWALDSLDEETRVVAGPALEPDSIFATIQEASPQSTHMSIQRPYRRTASRTLTAVFEQGSALTGITSLFARGTSDALDSQPPLPISWRGSEGPLRPIELVGVGLGVFGLRSIPLIDRELERDVIWKAITEVSHSKRPRLVLLTGPAGVGKSRLVEWMTQRAHEVGGATVLEATHNPLVSPGDGLGGMMARHMRCVGLPRAQSLARTKSFLLGLDIYDEYEASGLVDQILPASEEPDVSRFGQVDFERPSRRYPLLRRTLEAIGRRRPVILKLEDVQWGSDALGFANYLLREATDSPCPILMLMTLREDVLEDRPVESEQVEKLASLDAFERLDVAPLKPEHTSALVRTLLHLEGDLANKVVQRSGGLPLYAVQLVGDLVRRGVLRVGATGFELREGAVAVLPDDIHDVWRERVERIVDHFGAERYQALLSLELAAVLGLEVNRDEWVAACRAADVEIPDGIVEVLAEQHLARFTEGASFRFVDRMLRESLGRMVINAGRWAHHNLACAQALQSTGDPSAHAPERLARFYAAAGHGAAAVGPLLRAAKGRIEACEYQVARALLAERDAVLSEMNVAKSDIRWGLGWVLQSSALNFQARYQPAQAWCARTIEAAKRYDWDSILPGALRQKAHALRETGELQKAAATLGQALPIYRETRDIEGEAHCLSELGAIARQTGRLARSEELMATALDKFQEVEHRVGVATCLNGLGILATFSDDLGKATQHLRGALQIFKQEGNRFGVARCLNNLAEVSRRAGDLDTAEVGYCQSMAHFEAIGSAEIWLAQLNLGLVQLARGDYAGARAVLETVRTTLLDLGQKVDLAAVVVALLPCLAGTSSWSDWDRQFDEAVSLLDDTEAAGAEFAQYFSLAGRLARASDNEARSIRAYQQAAIEWEKIGEADQAETSRTLALEGPGQAQSGDRPTG
jgi:serine/threonine protein kinase/tetratricopeptide (TPR) repeat protein